jgi:hypothetical protein
VNPLDDAVAWAPRAYYFLGADRELLYVGKASDLRRRLGDHARDVSRTGDPAPTRAARRGGPRRVGAVARRRVRDDP